MESLGPSLAIGGRLKLWVVYAQNPDASLVERAEAWCGSVKLTAHAELEGPVLLLSIPRWTASRRRAEALSAWLTEQGTVTLLMREQAGHRADHLLPCSTALAALEPLTLAAGPYVKPHPLRYSRELHSREDLREVILAWSRGSLRAEVIHEALGTLLRSARTKASREVLHDELLERLPGWLGRDFSVDSVLREVLATISGLSPTSVAMPDAFGIEVEQRLRGTHQRDEDAEAAVLWGEVKRVRAAMKKRRWQALVATLDSSSNTHAATLLALTHDERLALVQQFELATRVANAGVHLVSAGRFADALTLYDAAVEGPLASGAAANPLFAVQDDNHHLGIDAPRARRYLERCLPHAAQNPTIYLNASFVFMELKESGEALRMLELAKAAKIPIKAHRNERLFAPLRELPAFKTLMR